MFFRIRVAHFSVFCVIFLSALFFAFVFIFVLSCFLYGLFVTLFVFVQCLTPNIVCVSVLSVSLDCPLTIASSVFFNVFIIKNGKNIVKKDRNNILYMYINLCMIY